MATKKKTAREELLAKMQKCTIISVNGVTYFGVKEKKDEDGVTKITSAVLAEETITETVTKWVKANNLDNLEEIEISGDGVTFGNKKLTEDQQDEAELIIIRAARVATNAVANLVNDQL